MENMGIFACGMIWQITETEHGLVILSSTVHGHIARRVKNQTTFLFLDLVGKTLVEQRVISSVEGAKLNGTTLTIEANKTAKIKLTYNLSDTDKNLIDELSCKHIYKIKT